MVNRDMSGLTQRLIAPRAWSGLLPDIRLLGLSLYLSLMNPTPASCRTPGHKACARKPDVAGLLLSLLFVPSLALGAVNVPIHQPDPHETLLVETLEKITHGDLDAAIAHAEKLV